jgi:hypothetical protein
LGYGPIETTPEHSRLTRSHRRIAEEIHAEVFRLVLSIAAEHGMVGGKTVAVDATTLEANAAMRRIVRRDAGEDYRANLKRLAEAAGIENPTDEPRRRFDKNRTDKTVSKDDWHSPSSAYTVDSPTAADVSAIGPCTWPSAGKNVPMTSPSVIPGGASPSSTLPSL